jgi:hypothetical protein
MELQGERLQKQFFILSAQIHPPLDTAGEKKELFLGVVPSGGRRKGRETPTGITYRDYPTGIIIPVR